MRALAAELGIEADKFRIALLDRAADLTPQSVSAVVIGNLAIMRMSITDLGSSEWSQPFLQGHYLVVNFLSHRSLVK